MSLALEREEIERLLLGKHETELLALFGELDAYKVIRENADFLTFNYGEHGYTCEIHHGVITSVNGIDDTRRYPRVKPSFLKPVCIHSNKTDAVCYGHIIDVSECSLAIHFASPEIPYLDTEDVQICTYLVTRRNTYITTTFFGKVHRIENFEKTTKCVVILQTNPIAHSILSLKDYISKKIAETILDTSSASRFDFLVEDFPKLSIKSDACLACSSKYCEHFENIQRTTSLD